MPGFASVYQKPSTAQALPPPCQPAPMSLPRSGSPKGKPSTCWVTPSGDPTTAPGDRPIAGQPLTLPSELPTTVAEAPSKHTLTRLLFCSCHPLLTSHSMDAMIERGWCAVDDHDSSSLAYRESTAYAMSRTSAFASDTACSLKNPILVKNSCSDGTVATVAVSAEKRICTSSIERPISRPVSFSFTRPKLARSTPARTTEAISPSSRSLKNDSTSRIKSRCGFPRPSKQRSPSSVTRRVVLMASRTSRYP